MIQLKAKIISNEQVAADVCKMEIKAADIAKEAVPGQFVNIRCSCGIEPLLRRPFSLHKINKETVEILYKKVGKGTQILSEKKAGDTVDIIGPLGNGFEVTSNNAVLIAGGIGIAPMAALVDKLKQQKDRKIYILIGAKTKEELLQVEFESAEILTATDDGSLGHKGLVTEIFEKSAKENKINNFDVYACGPSAMLKETARIAAEHKLNCQLSLEEKMGCGIGVCLGCAVKTRSGYKLVCKDGPVFNASELIYE